MKYIYDAKSLTIEELKALYEADQPIMKRRVSAQHKAKLLKDKLVFEALGGPKTTALGKLVLSLQGYRIGKST